MTPEQRPDAEPLTGSWSRSHARASMPAEEAWRALRDDITRLAHLTPDDWASRRGADRVARTINAARDLIFEHQPRIETAVARGLTGPGEQGRRDALAHDAAFQQGYAAGRAAERRAHASSTPPEATE